MIIQASKATLMMVSMVLEEVIVIGLGYQLILSSNRFLWGAWKWVVVWQEDVEWQSSSMWYGSFTCQPVQKSIEPCRNWLGSHIIQENKTRTCQSLDRKEILDTNTVLDYLKSRSPFTPDESLRNIDNSILAADNVNVDIASAIGQNILLSIIGHNVTTFSFNKKSQAVTLGMKIFCEDWFWISAGRPSVALPMTDHCC